MIDADLLAEVEAYQAALPLFDDLRKTLRVAGKKVGWHCHLTAQTVVACRCLLQAGAIVFMSECDPTTSDPRSVSYMQQLGATIFLGENCTSKVLAAGPDILCDTGGELISTWLSQETRTLVKGGSEITTSGIERLRKLRLPVPVVNLNEGVLKQNVENFHGVGQGVTELLAHLPLQDWSGRRAAVVGYGRVGAGVAWHLARLGIDVTVVETDPVRKLTAHYDGFATATLNEVMQRSQLIVTATGHANVVGRDQLLLAADGLLLINVGHFAHEIDTDFLCTASSSSRKLNAHVEEFVLENKLLQLVCDGHPANVVLLTGSAEPTLIHLTNELLTMSWLLNLAGEEAARVPPGLLTLPAAIESQCATLALAALGL